MNRTEFDHLIAAASEVAGEDELVVIGSQAILGSYANAPVELLMSMEADVYPRLAPEKVALIDEALGDGSSFHATFGFYAHGVGPTTAQAPSGWQARLVRVEIPPRSGSERHPVALCLEIHDLVLAKLAAGRDRDWEFARVCIGSGLCQLEILLQRCGDLPSPDEHGKRIRAWLMAVVKQP